MPSRRPQLAKLMRPRLHSAIARERLFRVVDEARRRPVTWIAGPPGAGKTTLVSTYLDAAGAPTLWYQVDSGDDDPATFFYYLREAALPFRARRKPLPLLTPEYLGDVPGFARRFFRELFLGLPPGAVVALDNYQDANEAGALHELVAIAIEETPPEVTFIVMSRAGPPVALARARVGERIAEIGATDLQLDFDETRAIAARRDHVDEATIRLIFEQSNGWTAGVMLLLERVRRDGVLYRDSRGATSEATFDYFASQIFHGSPPETRHLLMAVAWLPQVTVDAAVRVSGNANAAQVLEFLYRRHLFVDRRAGDVPAYQFHALFRAFLQHRAEAELGEAALGRCLGLAADVLAESGAVTEALPLLIRSDRWDAAVTLLIRMAPVLIGQGRWRTFEDLVTQVPAQVRSANAWLQHWLGQAHMASSPALAQETLGRAYELFIESDVVIGAALCAAGVIESVFHTFIDFAQMDVWIDRLDRLLAQDEIFDDPASEARVRSAIVMIAVYRAPRREVTTECVNRLLLLLEGELEADLMIVAATALLNYAIMTGDTPLGERVSPRVVALLDSPSITSHRAVRCQGSVSYWAYVVGRYEQAFDHAARAIDLAREHGLSTVEFHVMACIGYCYARAGMTADRKSVV